MSVDKFGRYSGTSNKQRNLKKTITQTLGVQLDSEKNLNLNGKRILNLGAPINTHDAVTRSSVQSEINRIQQLLLIEIEKVKQECNKLRKKNLQDVEANLKSYTDNALVHHTQYIDKKQEEIESYIFNHILNKKSENKYE